MNEQLAIELRPPHTLARADDPVTSHAAVPDLGRRTVHLARVLRAYVAGDSITDVEAARRANLDRIETTRRASELRSAGLILPLVDDAGRLITAKLPTGRRGMLCTITEEGRKALA